MLKEKHIESFEMLLIHKPHVIVNKSYVFHSWIKLFMVWKTEKLSNEKKKWAVYFAGVFIMWGENDLMFFLEKSQ